MGVCARTVAHGHREPAAAEVPEHLNLLQRQVLHARATVSRGCVVAHIGYNEICKAEHNSGEQSWRLASTAALVTAGLPSRTLCDAGTVTYRVSVCTHALPLSLAQTMCMPVLSQVGARTRTIGWEEVNRRLLKAVAPGDRHWKVIIGLCTCTLSWVLSKGVGLKCVQCSPGRTSTPCLPASRPPFGDSSMKGRRSR